MAIRSLTLFASLISASTILADVPTMINWSMVARDGADGIVSHFDQAFGEPRVSNYRDGNGIDYSFGFVSNARVYGQKRFHNFRADRELNFLQDVSIVKEALVKSGDFESPDALPLNSIFFKFWVPNVTTIAGVEKAVLDSLGFKGRTQREMLLSFSPDERTRGNRRRGNDHANMPVPLVWMRADSQLQQVASALDDVALTPQAINRLSSGTSLRRLSVVRNRSGDIAYVKPLAFRLGPEWLDFRAFFDADRGPNIPDDWVQVEVCISSTRCSLMPGLNRKLWWRDILP